MKAIPALLFVSLAANAAAVVAFAVWPEPSVALLHRVFSPGHEAQNSGSVSHAAVDANRPTAGSTARAEAGLAWSDLPTDDFPALVARLRAAGFPPGMVRTIVNTAINEHFNARRRALTPNNHTTEYWKNPNMGPPDPKTQAALREMSREHGRLLREALGTDFNRPNSDEEHAANQRRQFGDLAPAKVEQIRKITADYDELSMKVREDSMGITLPEDRAKLALLEREKRADLERLLSPEELLDYDLRNSGAANELRGRLGRFEPTEQEFRALYAVQKTFNERFSPFDRPMAMTPEIARERQQAAQQLETQYQSVLGPERAAEFQKSKQGPGPNEDMLQRLVTRLELPPSTTATIVSIQQEAQQRAASLRSDGTLSGEQRATQLATLGSEATTRLTQVLGARGLEVYRQNGGQWLQVLTQYQGGVVPSATFLPASR